MMAEPVHGSAPDIAGLGIANPIATLSALALLLARLGEPDKARALDRAVERALEHGPRTPDLGGTASTSEVVSHVIEQLQADHHREMQLI